MIIWNRTYKCEICGHKWISDGRKICLPSQCGRCKSRKWHQSGVDNTAEAIDTANTLQKAMDNRLSKREWLGLPVNEPTKPVEPREETEVEIDGDFDEQVRVVYDVFD